MAYPESLSGHPQYTEFLLANDQRLGIALSIMRNFIEPKPRSEITSQSFAQIARDANAVQQTVADHISFEGRLREIDSEQVKELFFMLDGREGPYGRERSCKT